MSSNFNIHTLTYQSPNLYSELQDILALSNDIFSADSTSKYASLSLWKERMSHPSSVIIYLTSTNDETRPIAFLFAHPRTHSPPLANGETHTLHIWLAGVLPEWRRAGCLQRMVDAIPSDSARTLTVCTVPERFPDMWAWLLKRGWTGERELGGGKVGLSKLLRSQKGCRTFCGDDSLSGGNVYGIFLARRSGHSFSNDIQFLHQEVMY